MWGQPGGRGLEQPSSHTSHCREREREGLVDLIGLASGDVIKCLTTEFIMLRSDS